MTGRRLLDLGAEQLTSSEILSSIDTLINNSSNFDDAIDQSAYKTSSPDVHGNMVRVASETYPVCIDLLHRINSIPDSDSKEAAIQKMYSTLLGSNAPGKVGDTFFLILIRGSVLLSAISECLRELGELDPAAELQTTLIETQINLLRICERILEFDMTRMNITSALVKFIDPKKLPAFVLKINGLTQKIFLSYIEYINNKGANGLTADEVLFLHTLSVETITRNTVFETDGSSPINVQAMFSGTPNYPMFGNSPDTPSLQKTPEYMDAVLDFAIDGSDFDKLSKALGMTKSNDPTDFIRLGQQFPGIEEMAVDGQAAFENLMEQTGIPADRLRADIQFMFTFFENYRQLIGQITSGTLDDVFKNIITSHAYVYTVLMMLNGL